MEDTIEVEIAVLFEAERPVGVSRLRSSVRDALAWGRQQRSLPAVSNCGVNDNERRRGCIGGRGRTGCRPSGVARLSQ
jgi:hypothetical protein